MRHNHYCKKCDVHYCFGFEREPITDEEKKMCEEFDMDIFLGEPKTKEEVGKSSWWYSDSLYEGFIELPSSDEDLNDYDFCDNCKRFIKRKWLK